MKGADDIVARGLGGDAAASTDLAGYLGTNTTANINKQIDIGLAFDKTSCA